jgi:hypothetical protein
LVLLNDLLQASRYPTGGGAGREGFALHLQIDLYLGMGGGKLNVTQPILDDSQIDSGRQQVHRRRMPEGVRAHALLDQGGAVLFGGREAGAQKVAYPKAR